MGQFERIDFHSHILPAMDDGAKDIDTSLEMLRCLSDQDVSHVVLTPHYYSQREPLDHFLQRRNHSYQELCSRYSGTILLHLGAEVYYSDYLFNKTDLSSLCIDNTRTMLLELPYNKTVDEKMLDQIWRLIAEFNVDPVIAHIERYPSVFKSFKIMDKLLSMGCYLQSNLSSLDKFSKRRLLRLFKDGYITAIGTDAHNMSDRTPEYSKGYSVLEKELSDKDREHISQNMLSLLNI